MKSCKYLFCNCFFFLSLKHVGDSPNLLKDLADGKHPYAKVSNFKVLKCCIIFKFSSIKIVFNMIVFIKV